MRQSELLTPAEDPQHADVQRILRRQAEDNLDFFNLLYVNQYFRTMVLEVYHKQSAHIWDDATYGQRLKTVQIAETTAIFEELLGEEGFLKCGTASDVVKMIDGYEFARRHKINEFVLNNIKKMMEEKWLRPLRMLSETYVSDHRRSFETKSVNMLGAAWSVVR